MYHSLRFAPASLAQRFAVVSVSLGLALVGACSSTDAGSSSPNQVDGGGSDEDGGSGAQDGSVPNCTCNVDVNGEKKAITCGGSACVAGSSFECGAGAKLTKSGTACASGADAGGKDASVVKDSGPPTCNEGSCATDQDCISPWRCLALNSANSKKACFPMQLIFSGDTAGQDCLNYPDRKTVHVTCSDHVAAFCVSKICTASSEQPAVIQSRTCY